MRPAVCWLLFALALFGIGCDKRTNILSSDANGFSCTQCRLKFYTDADTSPRQCPQCKSPDVRPVVGFYCYQDQYLTLTPRGPKSLPCEKCQASASALKMPSEAELKAWGAVKKTKAEVGAN